MSTFQLPSGSALWRRCGRGARPLAVSQDRLTEKSFLRELGIATAPFAAVDDLASLESALESIGRPARLKTRRFGYDGKGQAVIGPDGSAAEAWAALGGAPAILEAHVAFEREISIIAVRGLDGTVASYDVAENEHRGGILLRSTVPARVGLAATAEARRIAEAMLTALDYVGVIGIEFFVVRAGEGQRLLVNEFAPRVHNSGHWTQDAGPSASSRTTSAAIAGWPLGTTVRQADVVMTNLLGRKGRRLARTRRRARSRASTSTASARRGSAARWGM